MNWPTIRAAIAAWVRTGSGFDDEHVIWSQMGRPRPSGPYVEMALRNVRILGQDWLEVDDNPLVLADDLIESVNTGTDELTLTGHAYETGDGPVRLTTSGTLPGGLALATDYWVIVVDADTIQLAASFLDAIDVSPTAIDITSAGTGTHTISDTSETARAGEEISHLARGTREAILQLQCFAGESETVGAHVPLATLESVLAAARLPTARDALVAGGVGVLRSGGVTLFDGTLGFSVFEPRAVVDVYLHLVSEVTELGTYVERVEVERVDEDGNPLDSFEVP